MRGATAGPSMRLTELLDESHILTGVNVRTRDELFRLLVDHLVELHPDLDADLVLERLIDREHQASTALTDRVALPHTMIPGLETTIVLLAVLAKPLDYDGNGRRAVRLAFLLLSPADRPTVHIRVLSRIARLCSRQDVVDQLVEAPSPARAHALLVDAEQRLEAGR